MYYGKEKLYGKVVFILVYFGIIYKNENKICMNRMGIFKYGLDFFSLRVNV